MRSITAFLILTLTLTAWSGEKATVQQIKGKKAIIRFDENIPFSVGQQVYINSADGGEIGLLAEQRNLLERKNSISLSSGYVKRTTKSKNSSNVNSSLLTGSVKYGFNQGQYEFGPMANVTVNSTSSTKITEINFGGFFEYNVFPNVTGQDFVAGPFVEALAGTSSTKTTTTTNYSPISINVGGFAKWFVLSPVLAFRLDASYGYQKSSSVTVQGFILNAGLNHYF